MNWAHKVAADVRSPTNRLTLHPGLLPVEGRGGATSDFVPGDISGALVSFRLFEPIWLEGNERGEMPPDIVMLSSRLPLPSTG